AGSILIERDRSARLCPGPGASTLRPDTSPPSSRATRRGSSTVANFVMDALQRKMILKFIVCSSQLVPGRWGEMNCGRRAERLAVRASRAAGLHRDGPLLFHVTAFCATAAGSGRALLCGLMVVARSKQPTQ